MNQYWKDYVIKKDNEIIDYFSNMMLGKTLFILGAGFDNRMNEGLNKLLESGLTPDIWLIHYHESSKSASRQYHNSSENNLHLFWKSSNENGLCVTEHSIDMFDSSEEPERPVAEARAKLFMKRNKTILNEYDSIFIDISAIPHSLYLEMLDIILDYRETKNLYIMAVESYHHDKKIRPSELDESAHYLIGYGGIEESFLDSDIPIIWVPVLGECTEEWLNKCYQWIQKGHTDLEICPVLPFPSVQERRADEILKQFRKLLFENWNVEKRNIIYASESNPFQVCRKIIETVDHYTKTMALLQDECDEKMSCRFVLTMMTSKLLSAGTFLAAYNLRREGYNINIASIYNKGYIIADNMQHTENGNIYCMCLSDDGMTCVGRNNG